MSTLIHKRIGLGVEIQRTPRGTYKGIASIGNEPDCVGDLMEAYEHEARVPFLLGHDAGMPALGDAYPQAVGRVLHAELALAPPGTSVRGDEARRTIEAGIAELSIGFKPLKAPRGNEHGGLTFPLVKVIEVSLVGAGCSYGAGIGGKMLLQSDELHCACSSAPAARTYRVTPEMIATAVRGAVPALVRKTLCQMAGRITDTDEDVQAVLQKARQHSGAAADALREMLSGPFEAPAAHDLAPRDGGAAATMLHAQREEAEARTRASAARDDAALLVRTLQKAGAL